MTNLIEIEYFDYYYDGSPYAARDDMDRKSNPYMLYINPTYVSSIRRRYKDNSNEELVGFTCIKLVSGEIILTFLTVDEIFEKINGKPKK